MSGNGRLDLIRLLKG